MFDIIIRPMEKLIKTVVKIPEDIAEDWGFYLIIITFLASLFTIWADETHIDSILAFAFTITITGVGIYNSRHPNHGEILQSTKTIVYGSMAILLFCAVAGLWQNDVWQVIVTIFTFTYFVALVNSITALQLKEMTKQPE